MPIDPSAPTVLVLASYEKGHAFLRACRAAGWQTVLLTSLSLRGVAKWPLEAIDDLFYMPDVDKVWNMADTVKAVSHLARTQRIDRVVPLDDYDFEMAAALREHLRVAGMGESTTHYFRDKLAMRLRATEAGIRVPEFIHALNFARLREFAERVPPPWVLKPRTQAGAIGIQRIPSTPMLFERIEALGDQASFCLLERYVPGDIFHVDSLVHASRVHFACASGYGRPPLDVAQQGDVFSSSLLERGTPLETSLLELNARVLRAMGLVRGAAHTEFIRDEDGALYFLETSGRVGGAFIADLIEAGTGLNPWAEWAKIEIAGETGTYEPPARRGDYAGLLISLIREEDPDYSAFQDPEIHWRLEGKKRHIGFIVRSPSRDRVMQLLDDYVRRVKRDFHAYHPQPDRPTD